MPTAVQLCQGSDRLVPVKRWSSNDTAPCPFCNLSPKGAKRVYNVTKDMYYQLDPHRPLGVRDKSKIDWSNV